MSSQKFNWKKSTHIFLWKLYLSVFRYFIAKNTIRAQPGQIVCIRYNSYRHKGKLAKVITSGWLLYTDENEKICRDRDKDCAILEFNDGTRAWNFTPKEYHIFS